MKGVESSPFEWGHIHTVFEIAEQQQHSAAATATWRGQRKSPSETARPWVGGLHRPPPPRPRPRPPPPLLPPPPPNTETNTDTNQIKKKPPPVTNDIVLGPKHWTRFESFKKGQISCCVNCRLLVWWKKSRKDSMTKVPKNMLPDGKQLRWKLCRKLPKLIWCNCLKIRKSPRCQPRVFFTCCCMCCTERGVCCFSFFSLLILVK